MIFHDACGRLEKHSVYWRRYRIFNMRVPCILKLVRSAGQARTEMERVEEETDSSVYDSEEEARRLQRPKKKKKAMAGAATYRTKFKDERKKDFPCISLMFGDPYRFSMLRKNSLRPSGQRRCQGPL